MYMYCIYIYMHVQVLHTIYARVQMYVIMVYRLMYVVLHLCFFVCS